MPFTISIGNSGETFDFSYNWSQLQEICSDYNHIYPENCNDDCIKIHLWYVPTDVHCKTGSQVADNAYRALKLLAARGIDIREGCDETIWKDYRDNKGNLIAIDHFNMLTRFAWHLERILILGLKYYKCVFRSDSCDNN